MSKTKEEAQPQVQEGANGEDPKIWLVRKTTQLLACELTQEEVLERAKRQTQLFEEINQLEAQKKSNASHFKGEIESRTSQVSKLGTQIRDEEEWRDVQCEWRFGTPDGDRKSLVRLDTGEVVRVSLISDEERQQQLRFETDSKAAIAEEDDLENEAETEEEEAEPVEA